MPNTLYFLAKHTSHFDKKIIGKTYLHSDNGLLCPTGTPQNQRKQSKKCKEAEDKSEKVTPARVTMSVVVIVKKALFFNGVELILPRPPPLALGPAVVAAMMLAAARARKPGGGGLARVPAEGGVGVGVRWRAHRAGLKGVGCLLAIVGVPRRTLHVVDWPALAASAWRARWRGVAEAARLRVSLG